LFYSLSLSIIWSWEVPLTTDYFFTVGLTLTCIGELIDNILGATWLSLYTFLNNYVVFSLILLPNCVLTFYIIYSSIFIAISHLWSSLAYTYIDSASYLLIFFYISLIILLRKLTDPLYSLTFYSSFFFF